MSPEIGRAVTRFALFLLVAAALMLFWVPRASAEFVVLVLTLGTGLLLLGIVALLARAGTARWARPQRRGEDPPDTPTEGGDAQE